MIRSQALILRYHGIRKRFPEDSNAVFFDEKELTYSQILTTEHLRFHKIESIC